MNIWSIGITIVHMLDLTGEWCCLIRKMQTVKYKRFHYSAVYSMAIAE